ncbi:hypothetical protein ABBQ32_010032 [Trebouxia sp. C0010 RCD-2024]
MDPPSEDNVPAAARPSNKNLAVDFKDEDQLQLVAEIMPGFVDMLLWHIRRCTNMYDQGLELGMRRKMNCA